MNATEVSAQEAVYIIMGMPVSQFSRSNIFVNTFPCNERVRILKSKSALKKLSPDSEDIYISSMIDHYSKRPSSLENISLAEFASDYCKSNKKIDTDSNLDISITSNYSNDDKEQSNGKIYKKLTKRKIIRFKNYNIEEDPSSYYRSQILLFLPWRNESTEIENVDLKLKYLQNEERITEVRDSFVKLDLTTHKVNEILNELDLEDIDDKFKSKHFDDDDFRNDVVFDKSENVAQGEIGCFFKIKKIDETLYFKMMRDLNFKQRQYCNHVCHNFKYIKKPIYEYVAGAGGVGKSRLINAIYQSLYRIFTRQVGIDLSQLLIILSAPTGKAAFNIKGITIHSAFSLPVTQGGESWQALSPDIANKLRNVLKDLKVIIIDEISMVGAKVFNQIDKRLRQIFKNNIPFGGVSILVFGDFIQLRPVGDSYIFQNDSSNNYSDLTGSYLWSLFKYYKLTQIMRQKDDLQFAEALNGIGYGNMTLEQIKLMESRTFPSITDDIIKKSINLFYTNAKAEALNNKFLAELKTEGTVNHSLDTVLGIHFNLLLFT